MGRLSRFHLHWTPRSGRNSTRTPGARRYVLVALLALFGLFASVASAQRYEWRDVEQRVTIQPDGRVVVVDTRTLWTDGDFGEAFICFGHGPNQSLTMLPLTGAIGSGPPAHAFSQPCEAGREIAIRNAERVSERKMRFAYVFEGTLDYFSDVVQWYWNLIQLDHPPIVGYKLVIRAPGPMPTLYDAFVHAYANPEIGRVWQSDDRSQIVVEFDRVPTGDGVEIRYLMDPALFDEKGDSEGLVDILRDERLLVIDLSDDD